MSNRVGLTTVTIEAQFSERGEQIYVVVERDYNRSGTTKYATRERMSSRSYAALVSVLHPPVAR